MDRVGTFSLSQESQLEYTCTRFSGPVTLLSNLVTMDVYFCWYELEFFYNQQKSLSDWETWIYQDSSTTYQQIIECYKIIRFGLPFYYFRFLG